MVQIALPIGSLYWMATGRDEAAPVSAGFPASEAGLYPSLGWPSCFGGGPTAAVQKWGSHRDHGRRPRDPVMITPFIVLSFNWIYQLLGVVSQLYFLQAIGQLATNHFWTQCHNFRLWELQLGRKDLGILVEYHLKMNQQHILVAKYTNGIPGFITSVFSRSGEVIIHLYSALARPHLLSTVCNSGLPSTSGTRTYRKESNERPWRWWRDWSVPPMRKDWDMHLFSLEKSRKILPVKWNMQEVVTDVL